jgi:predicted N-formylglutamate amidohydrolase
MASEHHRASALPLLDAGDPPPVTILNPGGRSSFLFIGDHAGNVIPSSLGTLGLGAGDLARHIGWDIGVGGLGALLAGTMDAVFVRQTYSRLVIDCNRRPDAADAMPPVSDGTPIPGNRDLSDAARAARIAGIHAPYQQAIADELTRRAAAGQATILVALHSFTPALSGGAPRPWQIGVLHDGGDAAFAHALLASLQADPALTVGDNEPYRMDLIDYTIPRHAYPAALPYAEIEVRQDLIDDDAGQRAWAARLARHFARAA